MKPSADDATLYLIGFRIEPDIFSPQLYTIYVNDDRPIMYQGQPILFSRAELAEIALSKSDCGAAAIGPAPAKLYAVFDITDAISTLTDKDEESKSEVLNLINLILDFTNCLNMKMPGNYRKELELLADHLTFQNNLTTFFNQHNLIRQSVIDALYWAIGMILYNSKIIIE
jgi:hypothetical protein